MPQLRTRFSAKICANHAGAFKAVHCAGANWGPMSIRTSLAASHRKEPSNKILSANKVSTYTMGQYIYIYIYTLVPDNIIQ